MFNSKIKEQKQSHVQIMKDISDCLGGWFGGRGICSQALFAAGSHNAFCLLLMLL